MKKVLLLLCGLILFCFCSCQAEEETVQKRLPPDRELTMEEALDYATPLCGPDLIDEIVEDLDLSKETYEGYYYLFNAYVSHNLPFCDYIEASYTSFNGSKGVYFAIYLPQKEKESIQSLDVVQLVGKISNIETQFNGLTRVEVTDAHCVKKTFQITARLLKDFHSWDGEHYLILKDDSDSVLPDSEIIVFLEEEADYEEGEMITATGTLRYGSRRVTMIDPFTFLLCMEDPERIVKE